MNILVYNNVLKGVKSVLSQEDVGFLEHLTCRAYFNQAEMDKHLVREDQGVKVYYIGEDVLYMFNPEVELLDVLALFVDVAKQELNARVAERLAQKMLGRNNGVPAEVLYK